MSEPKEALTVGQLKQILERVSPDDRYWEEKVTIALNQPSIGPRAKADIINCSFGFDWDKGLIFHSNELLTKKTPNQSLWEQAHEFLVFLATKPCKKQSYEIRTARRLLVNSGLTEEKIDSWGHLFHEEHKIKWKEDLELKKVQWAEEQKRMATPYEPK